MKQPGTVGLALALALWLSFLSAPVLAGKVLIIHSYGQENYWTRSQSRGLKQVLNGRYEITEMYLDVRRVSPKALKSRFRQLPERVRAVKPDLILMTDDAALLNTGQALSGIAPVVFLGVNGSLNDEYAWVGKNDQVTGVVERPLIKRGMIELSRALGLGSSSTLILIGDNEDGDLIWRSDLDAREGMSLEGKLEFVVRRPKHLEDWQQAVREAKAQGYQHLWVVAPFSLTDRKGQPAVTEDLVKWISGHADLPVFTVHEDLISRQRFTGGYVIDGEALGVEAARIALEILEFGRVPGTVPVRQQSVMNLLFSKKRLARWGYRIHEQYLGAYRLLY